MNSTLFRRQFLMTTQPGFSLPWAVEIIGDYKLYYQRELCFCSIQYKTNTSKEYV